MRRLLFVLASVLASRTGHRSRLNGGKPKSSALVGRNATIPAESGLQWLAPPILRMRVLAMRIRLPHFHQSIRDPNSVAINHAPLNRDALTGHPFAGQVVTVQPLHAEFEKRANRLRSSRSHSHLLFHRRGFAPAQDEVEPVAERMLRYRCIPVENRNKSAARFLVGSAIENR